MNRVRTPGDQARYNIYVYRNELRESGREFPERASIKAGPSRFVDVLVNATPEEIKSIPDEAAIAIDEYTNEDGEPGWPRSGSTLLQHFDGWDVEDVFFSSDDATTSQTNHAVDREAGLPTTADASRAKRPGGRKPSPWWTEVAAQLAYLVVEEGLKENASEMIGIVQERVAAQGYDEPSRASLQIVVSRLYKLMNVPEVRR